jgi:hypothetical protein
MTLGSVGSVRCNPPDRPSIANPYTNTVGKLPLRTKKHYRYDTADNRNNAFARVNRAGVPADLLAA